jgi:hypothetical protein
MINLESLVSQFFAQEVAKLPPEAREALRNLSMEIVRLPDRVIVKAKPGDNPASGKAAQVILDSVIQPLSRFCAAFGTKTEIYR